MPSLLKPLHASSKISSSFIYRSVDAWNHLPSNIELLTSLYSFKSAIKLFDLSPFLMCSFLINYVIRYYCPFYYVVFKFNGLLLAVVNGHF